MQSSEGSYSTGSRFGAPVNLVPDGGDPTDVYLTGDVDGDGDSDLVYGRASSASAVKWFVRRSTGQGLGNYETWVNDAGDIGDVFRIGDVNGAFAAFVQAAEGGLEAGRQNLIKLLEKEGLSSQSAEVNEQFKKGKEGGRLLQ